MSEHEPPRTPTSLDRLLNYREAGDLLGVTARTIFSLVHRGDLLAVRFGGSVRIDPRDLGVFIDRSKARSGSGVENGG